MSSSSQEIVESWIASFCSLLGHEYFAEVSEDFIEDDFNLTGLSSQVPMYKEALEMILDVEPEEDEEDEEEEEDDDDDEDLGEDGKSSNYHRGIGAMEKKSLRVNHDMNVIENSAELLYGLIHQRYITSRPGMGQMHEKYGLGHFGNCPRVMCNACKVLPVGCSDTPGQETVKLFCPSCLDTYTPPNSRFQSVDGAFFGTTFGCLFFMTFPEQQVGPNTPGATSSDAIATSSPDTNINNTNNMTGAAANATPTTPTATSSSAPPTEINGVATTNLAPGLGAPHIYEPRIYGFRVSEKAKTGPRMKWLRQKPDDVRELDEARRYHSSRPGSTTLAADMEDVDPAEEDMVGGLDGEAVLGQPQMQAQMQMQSPAVDRRKKAPIRRRRRVGSLGPAEGASSTGGMNGVNGVG